MTSRFLLLIPAILTFGITFLTPPSRADGFLENGVTAHRGSSLAHPENTFPAFVHALELGVDWIEVDVFTTDDGYLVVHHDATTGRTADRDLKIGESTLAELRELDVAFHYRQEKGLSTAELPVQRMPLLAEVLELLLSQKETRLSIQPKDESVAAAIRLIREKGAQDHCGFNDGSLGKMTQVKQLMPSLHVFWDRPAEWEVAGDIVIALERGFESLIVHHEGLDAASIDAVKAAGLEAGAWTVNDPAMMRKLLDEGIDRLYTDDPGRLLAMKRGD